MPKEKNACQYERLGNNRSKIQILIMDNNEVFISGLSNLSTIMLMQDNQPCRQFGKRNAFKAGTLVEANDKCYLVPDSTDYFYDLLPSDFCTINGKKALEFPHYKPVWKK